MRNKLKFRQTFEAGKDEKLFKTFHNDRINVDRNIVGKLAHFPSLGDISDRRYCPDEARVVLHMCTRREKSVR